MKIQVNGETKRIKTSLYELTTGNFMLEFLFCCIIMGNYLLRAYGQGLTLSEKKCAYKLRLRFRCTYGFKRAFALFRFKRTHPYPFCYSLTPHSKPKTSDFMCFSKKIGRKKCLRNRRPGIIEQKRVYVMRCCFVSISD
jgi:hypothetical protein